ncbi:MAG: DUF2332 domain-containing protein [Jatrophihabitans sp.]
MIAEHALDELRDHFLGAADEVFITSPLYRAFCHEVAGSPEVLGLLADRRPGQQPSYLLFAAVQYLLLDGVAHPLGQVYADAARHAPVPPAAGPLLLDFVRANRDAVHALIRNRLVQTNVVRRAVGLRYALSVLAQTTPGPVHLVEVGTSAGIHLNVDHYRFAFGTRLVGPPDSPVTITTQLRSAPPVDLTAIPQIASRVGIDLRPVQACDPDQRSWLRALVWPENRADADLLDATLAVTASAPPRLITGDAVDICPALGRELPAGEARVVFHAATRMHVPRPRWAAFDEAIDAMGATGPLFHVWQESPEITHGGGPVLDDRAGLYLHGPDGVILALAAMDGHGRWIEPLEPR